MKYLLFIFIFSLSAFGQDITATTADGKEVILKPDKTWEYKIKEYSRLGPKETDLKSLPTPIESDSLESIMDVFMENRDKFTKSEFETEAEYLSRIETLSKNIKLNEKRLKDSFIILGLTLDYNAEKRVFSLLHGFSRRAFNYKDRRFQLVFVKRAGFASSYWLPEYFFNTPEIQMPPGQAKEMKDTTTLSQNLEVMPESDFLLSRGCKKTFRSNGEFSAWKFNENDKYKENDKYPFFKLFTAKDGLVYITANVSIPNFLFGSNVRLPNQDEVFKGLEKLSEYATNKLGIEFDAKNANVWKVHFTKDFQVGENYMKQVLTELSEMEIPRFDKGRYDNTSLYYHSKGKGKFQNKARTICIYRKHAERLNKSHSPSEIQKAAVILRLEFELNTTASVRRFVEIKKIPNRKAQTILTENISKIALTPFENQILPILQNINSSNDNYLILSENFNSGRLPKLIQFLYLLNQYGADFHKNKSLKFTKSAYYSCLKDLIKVGVTRLGN